MAALRVLDKGSDLNIFVNGHIFMVLLTRLICDLGCDSLPFCDYFAL